MGSGDPEVMKLYSLVLFCPLLLVVPYVTFRRYALGSDFLLLDWSSSTGGVGNTVVVPKLNELSGELRVMSRKSFCLIIPSSSSIFFNLLFSLLRSLLYLIN